MAKKVETEETQVVEPDVVDKKEAESEAKKSFRKLIEVYKEQNPAKYELKKAELEAKLNNL